MLSATSGANERIVRSESVGEASDERHHGQHGACTMVIMPVPAAQAAEALQEHRYQQLAAEHANREHEVDQHGERKGCRF
jgi:hypothetical protein